MGGRKPTREVHDNGVSFVAGKERSESLARRGRFAVESAKKWEKSHILDRATKWRRTNVKLRESSQQEAAVWLDCDSADLDYGGKPVGR